MATDSIKNTVNVFAKQKLGAETEAFGVVLGEHFLKTYQHVSRVEVMPGKLFTDTRASLLGIPAISTHGIVTLSR